MTREVFTWLFVGLMFAIVLQRIFASFRQRGAIRGDVKHEWTFPVLMVLYSAICVGTFLEYFLACRPLKLLVSGTGLVLLSLSIWLRELSIRALGRFWSLHVEIRDGHQLMTHGVYSWVRHPIYLSVILESLAIPLLGTAYFTLLGTVSLYWPVLLLRMRAEEASMLDKFGKQYRQYQGEVPALIPSWRRKAASR